VVVLHLSVVSRRMDLVVNGGGTNTSRGEVRSFRGVRSGFSRSHCNTVVPGVLACVHMHMLYVYVYMCVCMRVYEHAYMYIYACIYVYAYMYIHVYMYV